MNLESKNNAKEALNNFKAEIYSELEYHCNMKTIEIKDLTNQDNLKSIDESLSISNN